jgi:UDP-glucose:(heptosyl)LPS alpha-1,3-glucosyltransferase
MRIGLVIEHFDPQRGGAEHWTFQFAQWLQHQGHEVHVVAQDISAVGQSLAVIPHLLGAGLSRLKFAEAAERKLRTLSLDVIHDMGSGWYCDIFESHDGSRLAQWERKLQLLPPAVRPLKRMLLRWAPRYREFRRLIQRQFASPDRLVLAVSQAVAEDYQRYHGVAPQRIRTIYNGVDTERFSPIHRDVYRKTLRQSLGAAEHETLFLFVGHDFHRKGLATAIHAMQTLLSDGTPARLLVIGGKRLASYRDWCCRLGLAKVVTFLGSIRDPLPYYVASDAFVLPTFYDPCSISVLEAAACGLPCVTTACNGAAELLTEGVNGFVLANPADDRGLAGFLQTLLDPIRRLEMGKAARNMALRHTMECNCQEVFDLYREIAAQKRLAA